MKGLETALIEIDFRERRKRRSFSILNRLFSCASMPNALTIRVPEMVSWSSEVRLPSVTCARVAICLIFWPNLAMG